MRKIDRSKVLESIEKVEKWIEDNNYKGYEPFDGLSSWFRPLTFNKLLLQRILLQLVRQSPVNLRPLFGVKPLDSTIGRGYMAWGYCHMFRLTGNVEYQRKIESCLDWLMENKSSLYQEYSWGKHFDFASRGGVYKAFEPITIWTALICQAFLEAYELFGISKYLEVADSVGRWIKGLPRNQTSSGFCMGYHYHDLKAEIHNSNMAGAAVLARIARYTDNDEYFDIANSAMIYSCTKQRPDGSWWYGESDDSHWIDNFHTGYNLDALKCYMEYSGDNNYKPNLKNGLNFYKNYFFEEDGCPKYYHDRLYPIDSQCASQSIDTLSKFSDVDIDSLSLAQKVANWTLDKMYDSRGFFYYRKYPGRITARTPMLHWSQATTYKALTILINKLDYIPS